MKREYFLSFIAFFILSFNIFSQNLADTDNPGTLPDKKEIGIFAGLGPNIQNGFFLTDCNCKFENGRGLGFTIGALYEQSLNSKLQWGGVFAGFDVRNIKSIYSEYEQFEVTSTSTSRKELAKILFRNTANADFYNFILMPYIKFTPFKFLFVRLGFEIGINVNNSITQTKEIMQNTIRLSNGELVNVKFSDTKQTIKTIQDSKFPEVNTLLFGINPAIGGNIPLTKKIVLSPIIMYSYPMNIYSSRGEDFKVSSLRFLLELRYHLNYRLSDS